MKKNMLKAVTAILVVLMLLTGCGSESDASSEPTSETGDSVSSVSPSSNESSSETAADTDNSQAPQASSSAASYVEPEPLTKTITIPEGYTLARIGMMLEQKNICTADEFIAASQTGDFSKFPLAAAQASDSNRCFRLEGLLFPDTYEIYSNETPDTIIRRILAHTEEKLNDSLRAQIEQSGYTATEIITLASIIEKEALGREQMSNISSVLHNRLDTGMRLQCDVTIIYVEGAIKPFISGDINRYNSFYNTYKCKALPAGAICSPGLDAIKAALNPADTDYLYFVTDAKNQYYYASTWEEHEENVKAVGATVAS